MSVDIFIYPEVLTANGWRSVAKSSTTGAAPLKYELAANQHELFWVLSSSARRDGMNNEDYPRIEEPRGLPEDCSPEVLTEVNNYRKDCCMFNTSWLTLAELEEHKSRHFEGRKGCGVLYGLNRITEELKEYGESGAVRVVFWFDNP